MSNSVLPADRNRLVVIFALFFTIVLLLGIFFMLFFISRNGLDIRLGADINLSDLSDHITVELTIDEPIVLAFPQPIRMVASGPDEGAIPATLAFTNCPHCGGPMLPTKWNPLDGRIEWTCPVCGETGPPLDTP